MLKTEEIDDTLERIALWEVGLKIDSQRKVFLGQYVGKFKSEQTRQDLSTGYYILVSDKQEIKPNKDHFSSFRVTKKFPQLMGAMYKFYLERYLELRRSKNL